MNNMVPVSNMSPLDEYRLSLKGGSCFALNHSLIWCHLPCHSVITLDPTLNLPDTQRHLQLCWRLRSSLKPLCTHTQTQES